MRRPGTTLLAVLFLAPPVLSAPPSPPAPPSRSAAVRPAVPARLADLAWIPGRWRSVEGEPFSEESWSAVVGDSMVGTWRLVVGGRAKVFELLTLVEEEGRVILRLRHFGRDGVAWEDRDAPLVLPLVAKGKNLAVFEGREKDDLLRLTYRREGRTLTVVLEKGREPARTYLFRRAR